jgi:DNA-binding transcriptional regulator GbsR (MarR family)
VRQDVVEAFGRLAQLAGIPRSAGQIYGLLYLSPEALSLDDIVSQLGISKASASTGTRQLAAFGALRQVWVPGQRRDYFQAVADLGGIARNAYATRFKPQLESSRRRLEEMSGALETEFRQGAITQAQFRFCAERLKALVKLQKKANRLSPLAERFLG